MIPDIMKLLVVFGVLCGAAVMGIVCLVVALT
jgi:hypothetical protein